MQSTSLDRFALNVRVPGVELLQVFEAETSKCFGDRQGFQSQRRQAVNYPWGDLRKGLLRDQFVGDQSIQLLDQHLFADAWNGSLEVSVTNFPSIDLIQNQKCPLPAQQAQ